MNSRLNGVRSRSARAKALELVVGEGAVGESGQRVVDGLMADLFVSVAFWIAVAVWSAIAARRSVMSSIRRWSASEIGAIAAPKKPPRWAGSERPPGRDPKAHEGRDRSVARAPHDPGRRRRQHLAEARRFVGADLETVDAVLTSRDQPDRPDATRASVSGSHSKTAAASTPRISGIAPRRGGRSGAGWPVRPVIERDPAVPRSRRPDAGPVECGRGVERGGRAPRVRGEGLFLGGEERMAAENAARRP